MTIGNEHQGRRKNKHGRGPVGRGKKTYNLAERKVPSSAQGPKAASTEKEEICHPSILMTKIH